MTRTVRTTMRPDDELVVDDAEYETLRAQGLLMPAKPAKTTPAPVAPAEPVKDR